MKHIIAILLALPVVISGGALKNNKLPVTIADSDGTDYVIVRPANAEFLEIRAAKQLSDKIEKKTGTRIPVVTDESSVSGGAYKPREILIGDTNRGFESSGELYDRDFEISEDDGTVVIYSENPDNYTDAVEFVVNNFVDGEIFEIPSGYSYICRADYEISSIELLGEDLFSYSVEYDNVGKAYAERFCAEILEKTGRTCLLNEYKESADRKIVFGSVGSSGELAEYKVSSRDGSVFLSAMLGEGLELAYNGFAEKLYNTKGGKDVKVEEISASGSIEKTEEFSAFINNRTPLSNSRKKLLSDKNLRVAYFGGSVTDGYGSSGYDTHSWRALSSKWLEDTFPEAEIVHINAAIGGSGTYLGAYRTEHDIIAAKPDLLFIEFAINDSYTPETAKTAAEYYEAIVRKVRKQLPECDIVNVYVTDATQAVSAVFVQAAAHDKVAEAYGINSVNVGRAIVDTYKLRGYSSPDWNKYFVDGVHPTDAGYRFFADVVIEFLANEYIFAPQAETMPHALPEACSEFAENRLNYILPDSSYLENSVGYNFYDSVLLNLKHSPYKGFLHTTDLENSLTFKFTGSDIALFCTGMHEAGAEYTIDGVEYKKEFTWLNNPLILANGLEYGEHTVTIHLDISKCKEAGIAAILVR